MKLIYKVISLLLIFNSMVACNWCEDENHHWRIDLKNDSDKPFYVYYSTENLETLARFVGAITPDYKVLPQATNDKVLCMRYGWESFFGDPHIVNSDTLRIYILDADILESKKDIPKSIIQRYDLSLKDLQRLNWTLAYPPTVSMSNIKMWPPYGSSIKYQ
mgnify:CR=1 FL=1